MQKTKVAGVYRRKDGRFVVRATAKGPDGKMIERQPTLPEGATLQHAIERRETLKDFIRRPTPGQKTHGATTPKTLKDYSLRWASQKKRGVLKPSTRKLYFQILKDRVWPVLGDVPVGELSRAHTQMWVAWADTQTKPDGRTYPRQTRMSWWRVCKQLLMDAAAGFQLANNPVARVKPPRRDGGKQRTTRTLSVQQPALYLNAFRSRYPNRYAEIAVLASTGMRAGELYGLMWQDVNCADRVIHVRSSAPKGELTDSTKSGSPRDIPIFESVAALLREHRKAMMEANHAGLESGLVFPADNGKCRYSSGMRRCMSAVQQLVKEIDFPVTPQVIRRTANTLGHSEEALRHAMGHTDVAMTDHYTGLNPDDVRQVLYDAVGGIFG